MYNILNDDGDILNNKPIKTKKSAKQFIDYNYRCLVRDGFLEDYTFKEYFNECLIEKINNNNRSITKCIIY